MTNKQPKIMVSAGEASGDFHAANMIRDFKQKGYQPVLYGMGGECLQKEGMELIVNYKDVAVIGIVEVLAQYRKIIKKLKLLQQRLQKEPPDVLVLVDYQDFNLRLAKTAKDLGIKVLFYIGPQLWAWRPKRVEKIAQRVDLMAVIFPFEVTFYQKAQVQVEYVGHPLLDEVKATESAEQTRKRLQLNTNAAVITLLPGSRKGEIKRNLPIILQACESIKQQLPQVQFVLAKAKAIDSQQIQQISDDFSLNIKICEGDYYNLINAANCVITSSGTATLETGLLAKPMVIMYRVNPLTYAIMNPLITIKHIGLANIVAGKEVVKEYIQNAATADNISKEAIKILTDHHYRENMIAELSKLRSIMGEHNQSCTIADCIEKLL